MDDPDKIVKNEYQASKKKVYSTWESFWMFFNVYWTFILVFFYCIPEALEYLKRKLFGMQKKDVKNQLALVTGGGNGLGMETAFELARHGCHIAIADIVLESAEKVAKEITEKYNVKAKGFKTDVSDFNSVEKLREDVENSLGCVDILVNNAGIFPLISLREGSIEAVQKIIDVNLSAHFWTCRVFLNGMIKRKRGHIVAISSLAGHLAFPRGVVYNATKFGVRGFMESLYMELCMENQENLINLTTVFPSFIQTRQEISNMLDVVGDIIPRLDPQSTSKIIVEGVLKNETSIFIPNMLYLVSKLLPFFPNVYCKKVCISLLKNKDFKFMDNGL